MSIQSTDFLQAAIEKKREEMIRLSSNNHLHSQEVLDASTSLDSLINQYLHHAQKRKRLVQTRQA